MDIALSGSKLHLNVIWTTKITLKVKKYQV